MYSSALLDKIGYLVQLGVYGLDDGIAAVRAHKAGFWSCFLPHVGIAHIDPGGTDYTTWKENYAGARIARFKQIEKEILSGERSYVFGPDENLE